jgi:hypothetical protein
MNKDFCRSIVFTMSLISLFRNGHVTAFRAFLKPAVGASLFSKSSSIERSSCSGPFWTSTNRPGARLPSSDRLRRWRAGTRTLWRLSISILSLPTSCRVSLTSRRYLTTTTDAWMTATILAEMLSGSAMGVSAGCGCLMLNPAPEMQTFPNLPPGYSSHTCQFPFGLHCLPVHRGSIQGALHCLVLRLDSII